MVLAKPSEHLEKRRSKTKRIIAKYLDQLPVLPNVVSTIVALSEQKNLADKIEKFASIDPTLALRICYLAHRQKADLPLAIGADLIVIGSDSILQGLRKLEGRSVFHPNKPHERELWLHSIQVALIAKHIAFTNPSFGVSTDEAYFCGLLHDIGRFVMLVADPDAYARLESEDVDNGNQLVQKERDITGYDHAELGALASNTWHLPPLLTAVIKYHHRLDQGKELEIKAEKLIEIVRLADFVSFLMVKHPDVIGQKNGIQNFLQGQGRTLVTIRKLSLDFDVVCSASKKLMSLSWSLMDDLTK